MDALDLIQMGCREVIGRMLACRGSVAVAEHGCLSLVKLTGGAGSLDDRRAALFRAEGVELEERCMECLDAGAVDALRRALDTSLCTSSKVAEAACQALYNLSGASDPLLRLLHAIPDLLKALMEHGLSAGGGGGGGSGGAPRLVILVCQTAGNISMEGEAAREACVSKGIVEAMVAVLHRYQGDLLACEKACRALCQLAPWQEHLDKSVHLGLLVTSRFSRARAPHALVQAAQAHSQAQGLCREAYGALSRLRILPPSRGENGFCSVFSSPSLHLEGVHPLGLDSPGGLHLCCLQSVGSEGCRLALFQGERNIFPQLSAPLGGGEQKIPLPQQNYGGGVGVGVAGGRLEVGAAQALAGQQQQGQPPQQGHFARDAIKRAAVSPLPPPAPPPLLPSSGHASLALGWHASGQASAAQHPAPFAALRPRGLTNFTGACCWMNSTLQVLACSPTLLECLSREGQPWAPIFRELGLQPASRPAFNLLMEAEAQQQHFQQRQQQWGPNSALNLMEDVLRGHSPSLSLYQQLSQGDALQTLCLPGPSGRPHVPNFGAHYRCVNICSACHHQLGGSGGEDFKDMRAGGAPFRTHLPLNCSPGAYEVNVQEALAKFFTERDSEPARCSGPTCNGAWQPLMSLTELLVPHKYLGIEINRFGHAGAKASAPAVWHSVLTVPVLVEDREAGELRDFGLEVRGHYRRGYQLVLLRYGWFASGVHNGAYLAGGHWWGYFKHGEEVWAGSDEDVRPATRAEAQSLQGGPGTMADHFSSSNSTTSALYYTCLDPSALEYLQRKERLMRLFPNTSPDWLDAVFPGDRALLLGL